MFILGNKQHLSLVLHIITKRILAESLNFIAIKKRLLKAGYGKNGFGVLCGRLAQQCQATCSLRFVFKI